MRSVSSLSAVAFASAFALACGSCGSCGERGSSGADAGVPISASAAAVVAEALPRCRAEGTPLALPGEGLIAGDVAIGAGGLLLGLVRDEGGKRLASVIRVSLDLATSKVFDVGPAFGDDPPPSPRWSGDQPFVAFVGRIATDGGPRLRSLVLAPLRLDEGRVGPPAATVLQQADESTAFDVAWSEGAALTAWDEDAPPSKDDAGVVRAVDRGFVKVQPLFNEGARVRVASPESSDADSPRLLARGGSQGGFWLAWLARKAEEDSFGIEGPGESRSFRWVEAVMLDRTGAAAGPVRRVSSEKGRAVDFELAGSGPDLVVLVEDEAAATDGAGGRIVRYVVGAGLNAGAGAKDRIESTGIVDGGMGHGLAELVPSALRNDDAGASAHWLAWSDTGEHVNLTTLAAGLPTARSTREAALDGARVVASDGDILFAVTGADEAGDAKRRPELRRFRCH